MVLAWLVFGACSGGAAPGKTDDTGAAGDNGGGGNGGEESAEDSGGGEETSCKTAWYPDQDGDGYGSDDDVVYACEAPKGHIATGGDCDDTNEDVSPRAREACNGYDDDCDGAADDADPMAEGALLWFRDGDGDGWGDPASKAVACESPRGYIGRSDDCDDADAAVHPEAAETCGDGVDSNCDGADCPG